MNKKQIIMKEIKVPEWWTDYKLSHPNNKDEYDPNKHCCETFHKDYCECVKEFMKKEKKERRDKDVSSTINFLNKNKIPYTETSTANVVSLNSTDPTILLSLKKTKRLHKFRIKGSAKWYNCTKEKLTKIIKQQKK